MIKEIKAKVMLAHVRQPDTWFGLKYNMNLYRGCEHQCIYCDSRSLCYGIEDFRDILVKVNAIDLLQRELPSKRVKGMIGTGSMCDPYTRAEATYNLTGQALRLFALHRFPVHVLTKSDMVLKDLEALRDNPHPVVSFSLTTTDDDLARKLEPGAPSPTARLEAMCELAANGVHTGAVMMPILPFVTDTIENIARIVRNVRDAGGTYIIPSFGMTLRDRQRAYYYNQLDRHFPGMRLKYEAWFGDKYYCPAPKAEQLRDKFFELCDFYGIATEVVRYEARPRAEQLTLF